MSVTLAELAQRVQGRVQGDPALKIDSVGSLEKAGPNAITFFHDKKYLSKLSETMAGAVILGESDAKQFSGNALIVSDPHLCFAHVARWLHPLPAFRPGIHPSAVVSPGARVAHTAWIGPYVIVEEGAEVRDDVYIGPGCIVGYQASVAARSRLAGRVTLEAKCSIGEDCLVHAGVVIGSDGFGFARDGERWEKVPQLGAVVIGNHVEIGANTTIDRGALNDTIIGNGVKLDNLIQIAHNVQIGDHTAIAACVGIAGSTKLGKRCTVGGQAGIIGHLEIADDVHITAGSLVTSSIKQPGAYSSSLKAEPAEKWRRNAARLHHLDEMAQRLSKLEKK